MLIDWLPKGMRPTIEFCRRVPLVVTEKGKTEFSVRLHGPGQHARGDASKIAHSCRRLTSSTGMATLPIATTAQPLQTAEAGPQGLTPAQIRAAYGFNQVSFLNGNTPIQGDGTGQTIAIIDATDDPTIQADLAAFDLAFESPRCRASPSSAKTAAQLSRRRTPPAMTRWRLRWTLNGRMPSVHGAPISF